HRHQVSKHPTNCGYLTSCIQHTALESSGVESKDDLKYVQQDDIRDLLPVIQQRKLLEAFKMETTKVTLYIEILTDDSAHTSLSLDSSPLPCSSSSFQSSPSPALSSCSSNRGVQSGSIADKWQENFEIPWEKMPEELRSAIANGKRPAPDKRRQMIRILVDEIRKHEANPTRSECLIICRNIIKQYPSSFADMTPGGVIIGGGFTSLLAQVKTRIENINRSGTLRRIRTSRISGQLQKPSDSYGCTQFNPELPSDETTEMLEQKRQRLETIYREEGTESGEKTEGIILKTLPSLTEDIQIRVITALESSGVESKDDLKYVQQDDIRDLLPVIQQRKLLEAFKMETTKVTLDIEILTDDSAHTSLSLDSSPLPCSSSSFQSSPSPALSSCSSNRGVQSGSIADKWQENFEIPWEKMPEELRSAIANGKRPAPDKRRQMIRILVDEIRKHEANPTRSECLIICRNIIKQYPSSFADMTPGGVIIGGGFTSLLAQVKTRIENINRSGTLRRIRTSRISGQLQKPSDSYGCTQFNPELPSDETTEMLEQKRQRLETIYREEGTESGEKTEGEDEDLNLIQLLMTYFNERIEGLILTADQYATAADVECSLVLPASPRLILLGKCLTCKEWSVKE
ncbi:hypothetical protein DNTS_023150, partial [Danionella cerebrum]